jgi:hypothetical protein
MLVRYFRWPSRIEQLRSSTGGHLLEGFAKELSQGLLALIGGSPPCRATYNPIRSKRSSRHPI